jgi:hypothetical protein
MEWLYNAGSGEKSLIVDPVRLGVRRHEMRCELPLDVMHVGHQTTFCDVFPSISDEAPDLDRKTC